MCTHTICVQKSIATVILLPIAFLVSCRVFFLRCVDLRFRRALPVEQEYRLGVFGITFLRLQKAEKQLLLLNSVIKRIPYK